MTLAKFIATFFCIGLLKPAPGTWGSALALPFIWGCFWLGGQLGVSGIVILAVLFALTTSVGWWATQRYMDDTGKHDPSEVVVDEAAGQMLTFLVAAPFVGTLSIDVFVAAFVLFRLFDIVKLGPVKWADQKLPGAAGVMLDDLFAGTAAGLIIILINMLI